MNLHLFLDVVAWIWGILLALYAVAVFVCPYNDQKRLTKQFWGVIIATTLCWAWIIAG